MQSKNLCSEQNVCLSTKKFCLPLLHVQFLYILHKQTINKQYESQYVVILCCIFEQFWQIFSVHVLHDLYLKLSLLHCSPETKLLRLFQYLSLKIKIDEVTTIGTTGNEGSGEGFWIFLLLWYCKLSRQDPLNNTMEGGVCYGFFFLIASPQ